MFIDLGRVALTVKEVAQMCGGIVTRDRENGLRVCSVCTDSREIKPGTLFICLRGARSDGHRYIGVAAEKGAAAVLAEYEPADCPDIPVILVDNSIEAIGRLAKEYSKDSIAHKVTVTGSVGKTTTKEMIAAVLSSRGCFRTMGNFNSVIGMPISYMSASEGTPFAVFELGLVFDVGFRDHDQINTMSKIVCPDVAVITNVGSSHLEHFSGREELIKEKVGVSEGIKDGGTLICDIALKKEAPDMFEGIKNKNVLTFSLKGDKDADAYPENLREDGLGQTFDAVIGGYRIGNVKIGLYGIHNVQAALIAAATGHIFGLGDDEIRKALASYAPYKMRQEVIRVNGVTVINDCYNASPESMRAACDVLCGQGINAERKLALLGDMLELGPDSDKLHKATGEYFANNGLDYLFAFGVSSSHTAIGAACRMKTDRIFKFDNIENPALPAEKICSILRPGDAVLIKASRGIAAERITEKVLEYLRSDKFINRKGNS